MPWFVVARCTAVAASIAVYALIGQPDAVRAAEPQGTESGARAGVKSSVKSGDEAITFDEYRNWRLAAMERRRSEIDVQLAAADLPERRKTRLEDTRTYYNWLAGLSETERDRRFRERFDRIDANHDGVLDPGERATWRERQRAYYGAGRETDQQRAAAATHRR